MSPMATLVGSEALSTAFRPLTPVAPPAELLMLSQPAPIGSQRTAGMIGVGAAARDRRRAARPPRLAGVSNGIACGPDSMDALGLTGAFVDADPGAVEGVTNGPVRSEQPLAQPVAAGPTNVGADGPMVVALAACALSLAPAVADDPRATSVATTTAGITHRSVTR